MFHDEGKVLANLAFMQGSAVEIGTDQAVSTRYIAEGLRRGNDIDGATLASTVYTIDCLQRWKDHPEWPEIWALSAKAEDMPIGHWKCNWAFIDGDHSYEGAAKDIKQIRDETRIDIMLFHDCGKAVQGQEFDPGQFIDVRRAVLNHLGDWKLTEIDTKLGMIYAER